MSDRRRRVTGLLLAVLLLLTACGGARQQPGAEQPGGEQPAPAATGAEEAVREPAARDSQDEVKPLPGYRAPAFTATDVFTGETVALEDLRGQVVFLNFWATWCPPCKAEMPEMEALRQEMGDRVRIIALGADPREPADKMADFAEAMGLTFTFAYDGGEAAKAYRVTGIPTSFFIDHAGMIRARFVGALNLERMKEAVALAEMGAGAKQE